MVEVGQRIRKLREERGFSQGKLAEMAKVSQTTIDKIERGETKRSRFFAEIAMALGVAFEDLNSTAITEFNQSSLKNITSNIEEWNNEEVSCFPTVEMPDEMIAIGKTAISKIRTPYILAGRVGTYAIYVSGNSMSPEFEPGDILFVDPNKQMSANTPCIFFQSDDAGGRACLRRLERADLEGWTVRSWAKSECEKLPFTEFRTCHRIVARYVHS